MNRRPYLKLPVARAVTKATRFTHTEADQIEAAARAKGVSVCAWLWTAANEKLQREPERVA